MGNVIRRSGSAIAGLGWSAGWPRDLAPAQYALIGGVFTAAYLGLEWLTRVHELEALGITLWNPVKALEPRPVAAQRRRLCAGAVPGGVAGRSLGSAHKGRPNQRMIP